MLRGNLLNLVSRDFNQLDTFLRARREPAIFNTRPIFQFASAMHPQLATDIIEKEKEYVYKINAPGFQKENFSLSIEDGILTVSLKREEKRGTVEPKDSTVEESVEKAPEKSQGRVLYSERSVTRLERRYQLAEDADSEKVSAQFNDGVLEVVISKKEEAPALVTKIEIK